MLNFLYTIIIYPISMIIEFCYRLFFEICKNVGISVIGVSIAVTLLCIPLYIVAEKKQEEELKIQNKMAATVKRIKEVFKGNEQYMITQAYYRQNHYHPIMALRSSFSLLIQIPFFIAAYHYLSTSPDLPGRSFLFINDMGKPDKLINIGSLSLNVLPIAMTVINCISGLIYSKGHPIREKIQIFVSALIFLFLLYDSPSGLVLYWTMNNVFSLVKNIFFKLKNPIKTFYLLASASTVAGSAFVVRMFSDDIYKAVPVIFVCAVVIFSPIILKGIRWLINNVFYRLEENSSKRHTLFIMSTLSIAILTGFILPSLLVTASSGGDFCYIDTYTTPLYFLYNSTLQCLGLFFFWPVCIYFLFGKKVQTVFSAMSLMVLLGALINAFCFQGNYGIVSTSMEFVERRSFRVTPSAFCANTAVLILTIITLSFLLKIKRDKIYKTLSSIILITLFAFTIINCVRIQNDFKKIPPIEQKVDNLESIVHLSKTEKNVLVLMMDRLPGFMINDVFEQCPELNEQFTGFTFYPNTLSFGCYTVQAAASLYGGYEYTPWEFNQKRDIPMKEKHNQALSMLSFMFEREGFHADIIDPPYPNYEDRPRYEFLENHENVEAHDAIGVYRNLWCDANNYTIIPAQSNLIKRNFIWYSILKIVPPVLRSAVQYKSYWNPDSPDYSRAKFLDRYSILDFLPELTDTSSSTGNFVIMDNESTHDTSFTQPPEFVPIEGNIDTSLVNNIYKFHNEFYSACASMKRIGEWFDFLKQEGCYDNTRVIIVADHGPIVLGMPCGKFFDGEDSTMTFPTPLEGYNPVLLVKDFNEDGLLKTDNQFMTNADVPAIAIRGGVLNNNTNPHTGNKITMLSTKEKEEKAIVSFSKANAVRSSQNNGFKIQDTDWYAVKDNIFNKSNWSHCIVENDTILGKTKE